MNQIKYLYVLLVILVLMSCSKDDNDLQNNNSKSETLKLSLISDNHWSIRLEYNKNNEITNVQRSFEKDYGISVNVTLSSDNRIEALHTVPQMYESTIVYEEELIKKIVFITHYGYSETTTFEYDNKKRIIFYEKRSPTYGANNYKQHKFTYQNDNVVRSDELFFKDGAIALERYTLYQYDDKKNPLLLIDDKYRAILFEFESHYSFSKNNVIKKEIYNTKNDSLLGTIFIKDFEYREDGYPIKSVRPDREFDILYQYIE